jgi:hypothetical protein
MAVNVRVRPLLFVNLKQQPAAGQPADECLPSVGGIRNNIPNCIAIIRDVFRYADR